MNECGFYDIRMAIGILLMLWATSLTPVTILNNLFCLYMIIFNVFGPHCACSFSLTNDKLSHPHIFQRHYIQIPLGLLHSTVDRFIGSPWTLHHLFVIQKLNYCAFILHNLFFFVTIITPIFFKITLIYTCISS